MRTGIMVIGLVLGLGGNAFGWWDGAFPYRQKVTVDNSAGGALSDFQICITQDLSMLLGQGKLQAQGQDLRFVDSDDNTELDYYLETLSKVWVKVPSIPAAGTKTIHMYYANSGAAAGSSTQTWIKVIPGMIAAWNFDEGSGNTLQDTSGNGQNGSPLFFDRTMLTTCEDTDFWTAPAGGTISLDSSRQAGSWSVKIDVPVCVAGVFYYAKYDPPGTWDWSGGAQDDMYAWLKPEGPACLTREIRMYDSSGKYRWVNNQPQWGGNTHAIDCWPGFTDIDIDSGATGAGGAPDLTDIDYLVFGFTPADTAAQELKIDNEEVRNQLTGPEAVTPTPWVDGIRGQAMRFDSEFGGARGNCWSLGSGGVMATMGDPAVGNGDVTICGWINITNGSYGGTLLGWYTPWHLRQRHDGKIEAVNTSASPPLVNNHDGYGDVTGDGWLHVAHVVDRDGDSTLYVNMNTNNATVDISAQSTQDWSDNTTGFISRRGSQWSSYVNGGLDDIQVYTSALTHAEIGLIYSNRVHTTTNAGSSGKSFIRKHAITEPAMTFAAEEKFISGTILQVR